MEKHDFKPGEFRVVEIGMITTMDGTEVKGAIIEFPSGPPPGMTWADVWDGTAFSTARARHRPDGVNATEKL